MEDSDPFIEELKNPRPDPGGGSTAAHGAIMAAALAEKLSRIEATRHNETSPERLPWEDLLTRIRNLADSLKMLRNADIEAYKGLSRALKERTGTEKAAREACLVPSAIMKAALEGIQIITAIGKRCRDFLKPDALTAGEFFQAAAASAFHIGIANLVLLEDEKSREELSGLFSALLQEATETLRSLKDELGRDRVACRR